jgi:multimeric flavodoxin WrbA
MRFMIFNGSLKKSELSNTYAVCELVAAEFKKQGSETRIVTMNEIDYECGTDDYNDELKPIILDFLKNYDGMIFATPIWWGLHSGYISSVIERFDYIDSWSRDNKFYPNYNKVFGSVVSGGGDGFQHIHGNFLNFATQLGFTIPPRATVEAKTQGKENIIKDAELAQEIERFCRQMTVYATLIKGGNPSQFAQHQQTDK